MPWLSCRLFGNKAVNFTSYYFAILCTVINILMLPYLSRAKSRLHEAMQVDRDFTEEDKARINPCSSLSIAAAMDFVKNPARCCAHVHTLITQLVHIVLTKKDDPKTKGKSFFFLAFSSIFQQPNFAAQSIDTSRTRRGVVLTCIRLLLSSCILCLPSRMFLKL